MASSSLENATANGQEDKIASDGANNTRSRAAEPLRTAPANEQSQTHARQAQQHVAHHARTRHHPAQGNRRSVAFVVPGGVVNHSASSTRLAAMAGTMTKAATATVAETSRPAKAAQTSSEAVATRSAIRRSIRRAGSEVDFVRSAKARNERRHPTSHSDVTQTKRNDHASTNQNDDANANPEGSETPTPKKYMADAVADHVMAIADLVADSQSPSPHATASSTEASPSQQTSIKKVPTRLRLTRSHSEYVSAKQAIQANQANQFSQSNQSGQLKQITPSIQSQKSHQIHQRHHSNQSNQSDQSTKDQSPAGPENDAVDDLRHGRGFHIYSDELISELASLSMPQSSPSPSSLPLPLPSPVVVTRAATPEECSNHQPPQNRGSSGKKSPRSPKFTLGDSDSQDDDDDDDDGDDDNEEHDEEHGEDLVEELDEEHKDDNDDDGEVKVKEEELDSYSDDKHREETSATGEEDSVDNESTSCHQNGNNFLGDAVSPSPQPKGKSKESPRRPKLDGSARRLSCIQQIVASPSRPSALSVARAPPSQMKPARTTTSRPSGRAAPTALRRADTAAIPPRRDPPRVASKVTILARHHRTSANRHKPTVGFRAPETAATTTTTNKSKVNLSTKSRSTADMQKASKPTVKRPDLRRAVTVRNTTQTRMVDKDPSEPAPAAAEQAVSKPGSPIDTSRPASPALAPDVFGPDQLSLAEPLMLGEAQAREINKHFQPPLAFHGRLTGLPLPSSDLELSDFNWCMYYTDKRHDTTGSRAGPPPDTGDWRVVDPIRTVSGLLAICLNIGVEPPDQLRPNPSAKIEAWHKPVASPGKSSSQIVTKHLQNQFAKLASSMRYKVINDPSVEDIKKNCMSLRRHADGGRIILHYNGHGVPKPTPSGDIWFFNRAYTQYIPIPLVELQAWIQSPAVFLWDCSDSGNILNYAEQLMAQDPIPHRPFERPFIHLAACRAGEQLPTNPKLPADVFTSCLTTPVPMALWCFAMHSSFRPNLTPEEAKSLPGDVVDRRSPLGELHWIFTSIADTIAWLTLPVDQFNELFRRDLALSSLCRNFLLAQRIMSRFNCHPQSLPVIPYLHQHPLWDSFDLAIERMVTQLPIKTQEVRGVRQYVYNRLGFFDDQLNAFDIYLSRGDGIQQKLPVQLPMLLQVLLSKPYRVRALVLLCRFLDLGSWAVKISLELGLYPYALKLLHTSAPELKPLLVLVWERLLAFDISLQADLVERGGCSVIAEILRPEVRFPIINVGDHKAMSAFVLTMVCKGPFREGQDAVFYDERDVMGLCLVHIKNTESKLLRQWACLCLSQLWDGHAEAKMRGFEEHALEALIAIREDPVPEVRCAMVVALTTFFAPSYRAAHIEHEEDIAIVILDMATDASPIVRKEIVVFLSRFIKRYTADFELVAHSHLLEEREKLLHPYSDPAPRVVRHAPTGSATQASPPLPPGRLYHATWKRVLIMSLDPHPEVRRYASSVVDWLHRRVCLDLLPGEVHQHLDGEVRRASARTTATEIVSLANQQRNSLNRFQNWGTGFIEAFTGVELPSVDQSSGLLKRTTSFFFGQMKQESPPSSTATRPSPQRPGLQRSLTAATRVVAPEDQNKELAIPAKYNVAKEPKPGGFSKENVGQEPEMPLQGTFLNWATEYYRRSHMQPIESEEPGSVQYNQRLWRIGRNEAIINETQPQKQHAGSSRWVRQMGLLDNKMQPSRITLHQFEDHMAVADTGNTITIWDWKKHHAMHRFSNGNPVGTRINDMKFINEDEQAMLMAGTSDGVVRLYRRYESSKSIELVTAWRALTKMVPREVNAGMVFEWQQVNGRTLVAGDERVIRVWSAATETCIMDIPARSGVCITTLTSDQVTGDLIVAGYADGSVRVFDSRCPAQESMVKRWKDETDHEWIKSVHMQRGGERELLSASRNGKVRLWDLRKDRPVRAVRATKATLRTSSVHEHLPIFAM